MLDVLAVERRCCTLHYIRLMLVGGITAHYTFNSRLELEELVFIGILAAIMWRHRCNFAVNGARWRLRQLTMLVLRGVSGDRVWFIDSNLDL